MALRLAGIDPRREVGGSEIRKRQQQIAEIALGIDGQHRDPVDGRLFDQCDAEPGLAAAGHADADGVRQEIPRVVEDEIVEPGALLEIELLTEVEESELLVIG